MSIPEPATIRRYLSDDETYSGIPQNALVVTTGADYDDEKELVVAILPDLRDPECSAYLTDLGPVLAAVTVDPSPEGFRLGDGYDPVVLVDVAVAEEQRLAALVVRPDVVAALRTLFDAGVTVDQFARAVAAR